MKIESISPQNLWIYYDTKQEEIKVAEGIRVANELLLKYRDYSELSE